VKEIRKIEDAMNARTMYHIPKADVQRIASQIQNATSSHYFNNDGLDCNHTGIAIWRNGKLHFLHAPFRLKSANNRIAALEYLAKIKKDAGIMVERRLSREEVWSITIYKKELDCVFSFLYYTG